MATCYTSAPSMPKRFTTKIGPRDFEILTALDRTPLTPSQLCRLSQTFQCPFQDEHNLRRRLRRLSGAGLLKSWPYAMVTDGRSPRYAKLTREGYRLLYGLDAALPRRRYFEEINHGHHHHTYALAELIVHLVVSGAQRGISIRHFARENSVRLTVDSFTMYPDCSFQLVTPAGDAFNFVVELDNGTERIRTRQDVESIERKIRGYDAHQAQYSVSDERRYVVLFITTRSQIRVNNILSLANARMSNRQRTVFLGASYQAICSGDPFSNPLFLDHRHSARFMLPNLRMARKKQRESEDSPL